MHVTEVVCGKYTLSVRILSVADSEILREQHILVSHPRVPTSVHRRLADGSMHFIHACTSVLHTISDVDAVFGDHSSTARSPFSEADWQ